MNLWKARRNASDGSEFANFSSMGNHLPNVIIIMRDVLRCMDTKRFKFWFRRKHTDWFGWEFIALEFSEDFWNYLFKWIVKAGPIMIARKR